MDSKVEAKASIETQFSDTNNASEESNEIDFNAKSMSFRNLFKVNSKAEKLNDIRVKDAIKENELGQKISDEKKLKFLKPLSVIMLFLIVFCVSICTIVYLTYHQKSPNSSEYGSVKVEEPNLSEADMSSQHTASPHLQTISKTMSRFRIMNIFRRRQEQDSHDSHSSASPYSDDSQSLSVNNDEKSNHEVENIKIEHT